MNKKDYIISINGAERRFITNPIYVEKRMDEETQTEVETGVIEGYAALFNNRTDLGYMLEEVAVGAFDDVLNDDVRCLFNHDPNYVLARSKEGKGTLELTVDEKGLKYRYNTPDRTFAKDLRNAIASGDVSQSSFAFSVKENTWTDMGEGKYLRTITKVGKLMDVSPVTYPAYSDTSVAKRSLTVFQDINKEENNNVIDVFEAIAMYNQNKK